MRVREGVQGCTSGQCKTNRGVGGVHLGETYPSDFLSSLPAFQLTFWGSKEGKLQIAIT